MAKRAVVLQRRVSSHLGYISKVISQSRTRVSSTGSSFPADSAKPVPLAVVSLDSRQGQWDHDPEYFNHRSCLFLVS